MSDEKAKSPAASSSADRSAVTLIMAYRLFRLRRLFALAAVLPLPALALSMMAGAPVSVWMVPIWVGFALYHVLRFPNAWVELLAMGLTLSALFLLAPIGGAAGIGPILGYVLSLVIAPVLWMVLVGRSNRLEAIEWPQTELILKRRTRLSPEEVRNAFFLRPNAQVGLYRCGPANRDGVFEVTAPGLKAFDPILAPAGHGDADMNLDEADSGDVSFFATVVESDKLAQETMIMVDRIDASGGRDLTMQTMMQKITPTKRGALYQKQEIGVSLGTISGLGFWLNDVEADRYTATIDRVSGKPDRSVLGATQDSLLSLLSGWVIRRQLARTQEKVQEKA